MSDNNYHEESCAELVNTAVTSADGIVNVALDTTQQEVAFAYDPERLSDADVAAMAQQLAPTLHERWRTCTLRLGRHGGRACESCALAIEKELVQMPGVRRATASFIGGALSVTYDSDLLSPRDVQAHIREMGLAVQPSASEIAPASAIPVPEKASGPISIWDWLEAHNAEVIFTIITFVGMVAGFITERLETAGWLTALLYTTAYATGGTFGLRAGLESLRGRTIDVDLLMILAAVGAAVVGEPFEGVMLLFLFSLSNVLQDYALNRTKRAISSLMELRPAQANIKRGNQIVTLAIERVQVGDLMVVKPGERIALDGLVKAGESGVDQASITGESMPVNKQPGDTVFAGTINKNGSLEIGVTRLAQDSTIAKLIRLVEEAHSEKAETQRFIDTAEQYYAMGVIVLTALAITIPPIFLGETFATAFYRAMTIMVAASPCALVISTPATVLSAIGNGARRGILFKGGIHVENAAAVRVVAFDKTGTLTVGKPQVTDVVTLDDVWQGTEDDLLALAAAVEARSEHALAQATVAAAQERALELAESFAFRADTGRGVQATVAGDQMRIGNVRYFAEMDAVGLETAAAHVSRLEHEGKTSVLVARMDAAGQVHVLGVIAFADVLRPDAAAVVRRLRTAGIERIVMLTGDNRQVAQRIAASVGVDEVHAELLPEDKVAVIRQEMAQHGPLAMVGDGVNDAPALATATIGIAMGAAGTDVALETADVVLMADDLGNLPYMIGLSHATRRTLLVNLGFALFMILVMLGSIFAVNLPLPLAVIGHEGGTVLVSLNGLRLLAYRQ